MPDDRAIIAGVVRLCGAECRYCGCGGDNCPLPEGGGEKCILDRMRGVCSGPDCQAKDMAEKNLQRWARKRAARKAGRRAA